MTTLTLASLAGLPAGVTRPDYDPTAVRVGIIHLGIGAFHRAHQAVFTDDLLRADPRWGICGVNLPSPLSIDALNAQDGLYTVLQKSSDGVQPRVIGSLREALFLGTDRARLMARWQSNNVTVKPRRPRASSAPIRIGIASAHINDHSVWHAITKGWLKHMDRQRFEVHLFALDGRNDNETALARQWAHSIEDRRLSLQQWSQRIADSELDVLIYPGIGMDPRTVQLAAQRLAPLQGAA